MKVFIQKMVDSVFSFGELGFQEFETSKYLTGILEEERLHGRARASPAFRRRGWRRWGSGKPVIALGSDIDGIPQASQKPGVAYHEPMIEGAPGHGEGHNSGHAAEHHGRARGEEDHGAREAARARSSSGRASPRSCSAPRRTSCAPGCFKDVDVVALHARRRQPRASAGATAAATASSRSSTRSRARARTPPARRGAAAARSTPSS